MGDGYDSSSDGLSDFPDGSSLVIENIDHTHVFNEQIGLLYLNETYSDVTLIVDGNRFPANRNVLAVRSEYFRALLWGGMEESFKKEIELKDVNVFALKTLLHYVYTGRISLKDMEDDWGIIALMGLANKYCFVELETALVKYFETILTTANCCQILQGASSYYITQLKELCWKYADKNATELLETKSFLHLSSNDVVELICRDTFCTLEINIFRSVQEWLKLNPEDSDALSALLSKVRLVLISPEDLLKVVRPSKLVSDDVIFNTISEQLEKKSPMCNIKYRGYSILDNINVSSVDLGAKVIAGKQEKQNFLLSAAYDSTRNDNKKTYRKIEKNSDGIIITFGEKYVINHVRFLLFGDHNYSFSYYLEVSLDKRKWKRVVDYSSYLCRSWQNLYFQPEIAKYIRLVGTHASACENFIVIKLETMHSTYSPIQVVNGLLVPTVNVATTMKNAEVFNCAWGADMICGDSQKSLASCKNSDRTFHSISDRSIVVQLAQPYFVKSMRLLLWDGDNQSHYSYFVEVSTDEENWQIVADKRQELCKSWQYITFNPTVVSFIRLTGTYSNVENEFRCIYFECPAQDVN